MQHEKTEFVSKQKNFPLAGKFFYVRNIVRPGCLPQQSAGFLRCRRYAWRNGFAAAGDFRCRLFALRAICPLQPFPPFFRGFVLSFCGFRRNIASGVDFRLFLGSVGARLHLLINFFQLIQRVFALFSQLVGVFFHPGDIFVVPFFQLFAEFVHRFRQLAGIVVIVFLGGFGAVIFQFLYRFSGQFQHFVSEDADCFTYRHTC